MINKLFKFSTLLVQDIERYHHLYAKSLKNPLFQQEYQSQRQIYLNRLLTLPIDQKWKMMVNNLYHDSNEEHVLLNELIAKYQAHFPIDDLLKNEKLIHLLINENNIYSYQKYIPINFKNQQLFNQYELQKTKYRLLPLKLLFQHLILCEKLAIQDEPLNTFNLIHHNIEQSPNYEFLNELIHTLRKLKRFQLPVQTWILIFQKLKAIKQQDLLKIFQLIQQYAHLKIKANLEMPVIIQNLIKIYQQTQDDEILLELLRTINILRAHKIHLGELKNLEKICRPLPLSGNREFDVFMQIDSSTQVPVFDDKHFNSNITNVLKGDAQQLSIEQKNQLRESILSQLPSIINNNSLKKCMVLSCQLWPTDIQIISKCARQLRKQLVEYDKDSISLAINALHQFHIVQYPFVDDLLLNYLANCDNLFLNPQEISSIFYYLSKTIPKQSRKQLLRIQEKDHKINQDCVQILEKLAKQVQKMCDRNALRLKVIYTLTDCYSRYYKYLKLDFNYLFEKVEFNMMREFDIKFQCGEHIAGKDLLFLKQRWKYMNVGSRKLQRFFLKARINYVSAMREYLHRQKVYMNMRKKRGNSIKSTRKWN